MHRCSGKCNIVTINFERCGKFGKLPHNFEEQVYSTCLALVTCCITLRSLDGFKYKDRYCLGNHTLNAYSNSLINMFCY